MPEQLPDIVASLTLDTSGFEESLDGIREQFQRQLSALGQQSVTLGSVTRSARSYADELCRIKSQLDAIGEARVAAFREQNFALSELASMHNVSVGVNGEGGLEAVADMHRTIQEGILDTALTFESGIARSMTALFTGATSVSEAMRQMGESMIASVIQMLVRMATQAVLFSLLQRKTQAGANAINLATDAAHTYGATFASVMASLPFPANIAVAPGAAAGAAAAMQAGALAAGAAGSASGQAIAAFHSGGIVEGRGEVPAILQAGELVLTSSQQGRLFKMAQSQTTSEAGGNVSVNIHLPMYLGDRKDLERYLIEAVRSGPLRAALRKTVG